MSATCINEADYDKALALRTIVMMTDYIKFEASELQLPVVVYLLDMARMELSQTGQKQQSSD
jgi:hypothetical protein